LKKYRLYQSTIALILSAFLLMLLLSGILVLAPADFESDETGTTHPFTYYDVVAQFMGENPKNTVKTGERLEVNMYNGWLFDVWLQGQT